jgi:hypothetical protein
MLDVVVRLESTGMDERPTVKLHQLSEGSGMETQLEKLANEALTLTASERTGGTGSIASREPGRRFRA